MKFFKNDLDEIILFTNATFYLFLIYQKKMSNTINNIKTN